MEREADVDGWQRKVIDYRVAPLDEDLGDSGIPLRSGKTLPFGVVRMWSAPAGHYREQWFVVHPATREVLHEGPVRETLIWGLQAPTELTDEVRDSIALEPGPYVVVFALDGLLGGQIEVIAFDVPITRAA